MKGSFTFPAVVALSVALALPSVGAALELSGTGTVVSGAFRPEIGDEVHVFLIDLGPRTIQAEIQMVRADDLSVVATSGPIIVGRGQGIEHVFIPSDFPVLIVARFRVQGSTVARLSVQVEDPTGATKIFTDGFESGDVSV